MEAYIAFFFAIVILVFLVKIFSWPFKVLFKLIVNAIVGAVILLLINYFGAKYGVFVGINFITMLVAGILGIPGVIFLVVYSMFL